MMIKRLFDHLSNSEIDVETIDKLRILVLNLAVRGKLTAQNSEDEPASLILERLGVETSVDNDIGYDLPINWEIVQIGQITTFQYGKGLTKNNRKESGSIPVFGSNGVVGAHDKAIVFGPSIVIGRKGSAGALNVSNSDCWPTDVCFFVQTPEGIDLNYWYIVLKNANLSMLAGGLKPGLNRNHAHVLLAPIPPVKEQHRIVAKVKQLMQLLDDLETSLEAKDLTLSELRKSSLTELADAEDDESSIESFNRIVENAKHLFSKPEDIKYLRESILHLAVTGRLVTHSSDESLRELIEEFACRRDLMVKEKKLPKPIDIAPIKNDEVPFEIYTNWEWCHFQDLLALERYSMKRGPFGSSIRKGDFVKTGVRVFEQYNPINDDPHWKRYFLTNGKAEELANFLAGPGDFLVSCSGTLGRICLLPENAEVGIINQALLKITINQNLILSDYFLYFFRSIYFQNILLNKSQGLAQTNMVRVRELKAILVPLPPLDEQRRIVDTVDELMVICDLLEAGLTSQHKIHPNLVVSLIAEALEVL